MWAPLETQGRNLPAIVSAGAGTKLRYQAACPKLNIALQLYECLQDIPTPAACCKPLITGALVNGGKSVHCSPKLRLT
jgi:hypothetical protein